MTLAPGYFGHLTNLLLGRDLYPERRQGDEPEPVEVLPWPLARRGGLVGREDFTEADDEEPPADEHDRWGASEGALPSTDVFIVEGGQLRYGSKDAWDAARRR